MSGRQQQSALEAQLSELASDAGISFEAASEFYHAELRELRESARIGDFVPLLATKRVQKKLRRRQITSAGGEASSREKIWTRKELEEFEHALTIGELFGEVSRCREIVAALKRAREKVRVFERFAPEEKQLLVQIIERFDGFC